MLSLIAYHGDLGLDQGAQSVYVLDKDKLTPFTHGGRQAACPAAAARARRSASARAPGSITFDGYDRFVKLSITRQPGKVVPLVGVLAAIVGLLGSLFIRPRRTWVRARAVDGRTVVEVAALDRVSGGDPGAHVGDVATALRPDESSVTQASPTPEQTDDQTPRREDDPR